MNNNEKKIVSDEASKLTDEQISDAAGGISARAEEARKKAQKKDQKQRQAEDCSRLVRAIADVGVKIGSGLFQGDELTLGGSSGSLRGNFDKQAEESDAHEEGELE